MPTFDYQAPATVEEALGLLAAGGEVRALAGGTALLLLMKQGLYWPDRLVHLGRIAALREVRADDGGLWIGATATHRAVELSPLVRERCPLLAEAASQIACARIRNVATVGGSLCQGDPGADTAPVLAALDATAEIHGPAGTRSVPVADFARGLYETVLAPDEVLVGVRVPCLGERTGGHYVKLTRRRAMDRAIVGAAALVTLEPDDGRCEDVRLVLGGAGPRPIRAVEAEALLRGRAPTAARLGEVARAVSAAVAPTSDLVCSAAYKRHVAGVAAARAVEAAHRRARERGAEG